MTLPISAFIIAKNERERLPRTIASVRSWVDEIVVVDSGSTDGTADLARLLGAQVHTNAWTGYGPQKRFAESLCRNHWVLNLDADEEVTPELAAEIKSLFAAPRLPVPGAYRLKILTVYPGDTKPRPLANDYNVVRLYHRSAGSYRDHPVYDRVELRGVAARQLRHPVFHHSYLSFAHVIEKNNNFSSFRSKRSSERPFAYLLLRLATEFPLNFLKYYIARRHCMGGWKGFYFALCHAFMRTTRIAKMLELASAQQRQLPERQHQSAALPALRSRPDPQ